MDIEIPEYVNDIQKFMLEVPTQLTENLLSDILNAGDQMYNKTNIQGTMTNYKFFETAKSFKELNKLIMEKVDIKGSKITDQWGHVLRDKDFVKQHTHIGIDLAFCFYVNAPKGSGKLVFTDYNLYIEPKQNMLLVFDPSLYHEVLPNDDPNITRVTIAGNIVFY